MTVLQDIIDRWHAAHPGFPLTSGEAGAPTNPDDGAVAASVLRLKSGWPKGRPRPVEMSWRQGATKLGIPYDDYRRHRLNGERWCSAHRGWSDDFVSSTSGSCRPCFNASQRRHYREQAEAVGRTVRPYHRGGTRKPTGDPAPSRWRLGPNYPERGRTT